MSVSLTPQVEKLIRQKIATGPYHNADEVIQKALRLLDARDFAAIGRDEEIELPPELTDDLCRQAEERARGQRLHSLRAKMATGEEQVKRGELVEFTDEFLDELDREVDERLRRGETPSRDVCP